MMTRFEQKKEKKEPLIFSVKDGNRHQIMKIIRKEGPQRFKELEEKSKRSPRGLNNMLKDLLNEKKIEKVIHDGHQAYGLTETGNDAYKNLDFILSARKNMIVDGGAYYQGYSGQWGSILFCELPWGIDDDMILDKNISDEMNPITKNTAIAVQEFLFKRILSDVKKKKIKLDKSKNGTLLWEFSIEYKELVKSLEKNSLKIYQKVTKEELDLFQRREDGSIRMLEINLLNEIKTGEITKEQIRRKLKRIQKQINIDEEKGIHHETFAESMGWNNKR